MYNEYENLPKNTDTLLSKNFDNKPFRAVNNSNNKLKTTIKIKSFLKLNL